MAIGIGLHCLYCDHGPCNGQCRVVDKKFNGPKKSKSDKRDEKISILLERKIVFISSPYSHPDDEIRESNFKIVSKLAAELNSKGIVAVSPITYGHTLLNFKEMPTDWEFWKEFCLTFLEKSSEVIVYKMPGWENSRGMKEEIEFAKNLNIPIRYMEYEN
jgi:hypothetical protein